MDKELLKIVNNSDFLIDNLGLRDNIDLDLTKFPLKKTICNKLKNKNAERISDIRDVCKLACALFVHNNNVKEIPASLDLLNNAFNFYFFEYDANFVKYMFDGLAEVLKTNENMINIAQIINTLSTAGYLVSLSLAWSVFIRITKETNDMNYNHYKFSTIVSYMKKFDFNNIQTSFSSYVTLFVTIAFILNALLVESNGNHILESYVAHFKYQMSELKLLQNLCDKLRSNIQEIIDNPAIDVDSVKFYTKIKEIVQWHIIEPISSEISHKKHLNKI